MIPTTKRNKLWIIVCTLLACAVMLTGCARNYHAEEKQEPAETQVIDAPTEEETDNSAEIIKIVPEIVEADWSSDFNGRNGTAVVYDAASLKIYDLQP